MRKKDLIPILFSVVLSVVFVAVAVNAATTISTNISTSGTLTVTGTTYASSTLLVTATSTFYSDVNLGDEVADTTIVNGRISTGSIAGTALTFGATYPYGNGAVLKYYVSDWTGIGTDFAGFYVRTSPSAAATSKTLNGAKLHAANGPIGGTGYNVGTLRGAYVEAETKSGAATVTNVRGLDVFTGVSDQTTITNLKGLYVDINTGILTTTGYGIHIHDATGDTSGKALNAAIYVSSDSFSGNLGYLNGLDLSGTKITTADIVLQNSEKIDNLIDGTIRTNATSSVNGYATTTSFGVVMPISTTTAPVTCNANYIGGLFYQSTKKVLCFCDGTAWLTATSTAPAACPTS